MSKLKTMFKEAEEYVFVHQKEETYARFAATLVEGIFKELETEIKNCDLDRRAVVDTFFGKIRDIQMKARLKGVAK